MATPFPLTAASNATPGDWIVQGVDERAKTLRALLPVGFDAYARIDHPAWIVTAQGRMPVSRKALLAQNSDSGSHIAGVKGIAEGHPYETASTELVEAPDEGTLSPELAGHLQATLAPYTSTPETCWFAVWYGFGCLGSSVLSAPTFSTSLRTWHLLKGPISAVTQNLCANPVTNSQSLAVVTVGKQEGQTDVRSRLETALPPCFQSANLWWPDDHAWCVATDLELDATYVGGSFETVTALLSAPNVEGREVDLGHPITP